MTTKLGKQILIDQLANLQIELDKTCQARGVAAEGGDLKENSAYIFLGEQALLLSSQIDQIKDDLKGAVIQEAPNQIKTICFGHQVKIRFETDNREMIITLVGKNDFNLKPGWISCDSPLGIALLGKKLSDKVSVNGQLVTILDISIGEI